MDRGVPLMSGLLAARERALAGESYQSSAAAEYQSFVKAYRLKEFSRCPQCDAPGVIADRYMSRLTTVYRCPEIGPGDLPCGWTVEVQDSALLRARHPDDVFFDLVVAGDD